MKTAGCLIFTKPYQSQLALPMETQVSWNMSYGNTELLRLNMAQLIMKIAHVKDNVPKFLENPKSKI